MKIKFDKKKIKKIASVFAKYRYLLFILFLYASLVFTFKVVYDNAYLNVEFVNYKEGRNDIIIEAKKINKRIQVISENIEKRNSDLRSKTERKYIDPFKYNTREPEVESSDYDSDSVGAENSDTRDDF